MNIDSSTKGIDGAVPVQHRWKQIVTLLVLSPVIGEVLSGATRLSYIFVLVPEIMVWGAGTLLIREMVRRWGAGWPSVLLLGFGLAIAEEFIIQQTSLAPLPFLGNLPGYGRVWGVNWPYFAFMLGYEAVWIVVVPIQITELVFPSARDQPWLRTRGVIVSSIAFVFGSYIAWFLWTQRARPNVFHVPVYHPPITTVALGALAIVLLAVCARVVRQSKRAPATRDAHAPWSVALIALLFGFPWYALMGVTFSPHLTVPLWVVLSLAAMWGATTFFVLRRWALASGWSDAHRWALCFGALLVCMIAGFLGASAWSRLDTIAKAVLNVLAVAGMFALRGRIAVSGGQTMRATT